MKYFIADTHFFHKQLLGNNDFAPRPFPSVEVMDQTMIDNWNARIADKDEVYHLGDIAMAPGNQPGEAQVDQILNQLKGQLILIKGNHDSRALFKYIDKHNYDVLPGKPKFRFADVGVLMKFDHAQYYLTHYPMMMGIVHQIYNLHGHIHHNMVPIAEDINVGVDAPERDLLAHKLPFGTPLSEAEIEEIYQKKAALLKKLAAQQK
ncbi:phosphoesterase or phosphohydrolase [Lactobacillus selangorensis]|uniref:Phosphoesterase or phosphohydrolase n=1 Tax=Lactobacillus selangorensis TaxID=81857 RepID=A0A0R2G127_9LACO|nr:metallophosphoesterase [Lactobacillus selangorensis]KRN27484.1 phosphoesterase or phosphohydrolase [Lactobacillus selangorensis]KRN31319.1 phosphoesterase or phosphohydrolase [Lactobacillus selangorensis]